MDVTNVFLWVAQALLAVLFLFSGIAKSTLRKPRLIALGQTGVAPYPVPFVRVIAGLEIVGSFGLIVPWLTGISSVLTPAAAAGLAIIMVGAAFSHLSIGERRQALLVNLPVLSLCLFVAIGRLAGW
jgi:uncharacterized membrane protein YphA (DoxX/SURF4 family)